MSATLQPYETAWLPAGVRSRIVAGINGLRMHVLEAGHESPGRPCVLLLHGFPELAYSWRRVMPALAAAGYHVLAPDQRGYGRTIADGAAARFVDGACCCWWWCRCCWRWCCCCSAAAGK